MSEELRADDGTPSAAKTTAAKKAAKTTSAKKATPKTPAKKVAAKKAAAKRTAAKKTPATGIPKRPATKRAARRPVSAPAAETAPTQTGRAEAAESPAAAAAPPPAPAPAQAAFTPHRPRPTVTSRRPPRARTRPVPMPPPVPQAPPTPTASAGSPLSMDEIERLVGSLVDLLSSVLKMRGATAEEIEYQVAAALAFLRRRVTGDYQVDDFGLDDDFLEHVYLPLLRVLYQHWFRVDVVGAENLPLEGSGLIVANHSGTIAYDALMTQVAVHDATPNGRHLRMLGADLVFATPFLGDISRRAGATLAAGPDAARLLERGELVGVWPEGFKGIGKPFSERYKLQRFGRGGFVASGLAAGTPIIPTAIVGAEEIAPILADLPLVARVLGLPFAPVTPTWPLLGPLGMVPLPTKWTIAFGEPIDTSQFGPHAADDPMLVLDLTDQVRETIQQQLFTLLARRRSVFFG